MNIIEVEKVVRAFQGTIFKRSNSLSAGLFKSKIRGSGLQFKDHQIYSHGDDVRFIDWKVSARNSNIHLKTFEEERNSQIYLLLDISETLFYGSHQKTKLQVALEICALLYLITEKSNDQLVLVLFINNQIVRLAPQKGKMGIVALIKQLEKQKIYDDKGSINLLAQRYLSPNDGKIISNELRMILNKRKDIIFLSDFNNYEQILADASKSRYFHPVKLVSPVDDAPLKFSVFTGKKFGTGLSHKPANSKELPFISTSERYLELFLRRLR